jgi:hypothetical protein
MKVLFFSLNAAIWVHSLPESRLARQLSEDGHEIVYVSCGESFPVHCTSMNAFGVGPDAKLAVKKKICRSCTKNAHMIVQSINSRHAPLSLHIYPSDYSIADSLIETISQENYLDFNYLGIPLGRIATYETYLKYKKMSTRLSDDQWQDYCVYLKNCIISLIGFKRIYEMESPDKVFIYSPQYGANGVCAEYAINAGSMVYFVEGSSSNSERYSALRLWSWAEHRLVNPALSYWNQVKECITKEDIIRAKGHLKELYEGHSFAVFSQPKQGGFQLREYFKIPKSSKILLATLSSFDEAYSAYVIGGFPERKVKSPVFKDQFEWIEKTILYLSDKPDFFLIIRVHPRDYPNKRESVQSEQAVIWQNILNKIPSNVAVNSPEQGISIYDIFDQVDVVLTGWSATGVEALLHGILVVTYDQFLPSFPKDIHFSGLTENEYYTNIQKAIFFTERQINVLNAYRWLAINFSVGTLRITPAIEIGKSWPNLLPFRLIKRAINKIFSCIFKWIDLKRSFGNHIDQRRFTQFFIENRSSLFEVISDNSLVYIDDKELERLIDN